MRRAWKRAVGVPAAALLVTGGALAITTTPASAATDLVTTEAQLRADFDSNSFDTLVLQNDIHLSVGICARLARNTANNPITVDGQGRFKIVQDCSGFGVVDVGFAIVNTSNVTFRGVTITGATNAGFGAGIRFLGGSLTLDHVNVVNNHTQLGFADDGGGVEDEGTGPMTVIDSTIANNSSDTTANGGDGGGINFDSAAPLTITRSTIANNGAGDDGGGLDCNAGGTMSVTASTFNGNSTTPGVGPGDSAGAIDMESAACSLKLVNSTVTANTSGDDAAITAERAGNTMTLVYSSIVNNARNPATPGAAAVPSAPGAGGRDDAGRKAHADSVHAADNSNMVATANVEANVGRGSSLTTFGTFIARPHGGPNCSSTTSTPLTGFTTSAGYNLSDDTSCGLTATTDTQGGDPGVAGLANNGGPTQTVLPLPGSRVIDAIPVAACQAGPAAGVTTDQRGIARPQGAGCDIGAVEVVVPLVVQPRFTG